MTALASIRGFFAIPPGTVTTPCGYCGQPIYWIEHRCKPRRKNEPGKLSRLPISTNDVKAIAPTHDTWGHGFNHFADCPNAPRYIPGTGKRGSPPL